MHADSKLLIALVSGAVLLAVAVPIADRNGVTGAAGIASGVLAVATIVTIAIGVVDQDEVNAQSITGAVCIYLLFGILFMFLYGAVALLGSSDFFAQGTDGTRALRLYFSYVTLATLGYGDYTPAGNLGHSLAIIEALLGQLYLVTVLALLVSRLQGRRNVRLARVRAARWGPPSTAANGGWLLRTKRSRSMPTQLAVAAGGALGALRRRSI